MNELPDIETTRKVGKSAEDTARREAEQKAERKAKAESLETARFVKDNLSYVRDQITKKLWSVSTASGRITHSFGTSEGWCEIQRIIQAALETKGYRVRIEYCPGEVGRAAYDEPDIPASYEMYISW
jgi:hypothetical protein